MKMYYKQGRLLFLSGLVVAPLVVLLGVHQLGRNLPLVAPGVGSVGVQRCLRLASLLP